MKKVSLPILLIYSIYSTMFVHAQNVGVGTITPPQLRLHVSSMSDSNLLLLENRNPLDLSQNTSMYFKTGSFYTGAIKTIGAGALDARLGLFTFVTGDINGLYERMSILDNGNVGIATTAPTARLDVGGSLRLRFASASAGRVLTSDSLGNATWQAPSGTGIGFRGELANNFIITPAAGEVTITGFNEEFDDGFVFNGSAGTFTAPSAGVYQFTVNLNWDQDASNTGSSLLMARLYRNRSGVNTIIEQITTSIPNTTSFYQSQNLSSIVKLNAGDVISIRVDPQASITFILSGNGSPACRFAGTKLY